MSVRLDLAFGFAFHINVKKRMTIVPVTLQSLSRSLRLKASRCVMQHSRYVKIPRCVAAPNGLAMSTHAGYHQSYEQ